ncbi:hypothetical protein TcasGA2_TC012516 [Tribolium castaneum]|uniref:Uncharacterized protein n=1 Tax=Tribolium castaneum TaxID=7070 RepID=D6X307_TRICA|nr:hypothetical protein TcasGA2_TC012516 [Tribolium castaneum]
MPGGQVLIDAPGPPKWIRSRFVAHSRAKTGKDSGIRLSPGIDLRQMHKSCESPATCIKCCDVINPRNFSLFREQ